MITDRNLGYQNLTGSDTLYAIVLVRTPLSQKSYPLQDEDAFQEDQRNRTFHYHVPAELRDSIQIGQLVWVPFGRRYIQGVVIGLDDASPVPETRPIDQIVDEQPIMSLPLIQLAYWMSDYYIAPLATVIDTLLPPGVTQNVVTVYQTSDKSNGLALDESESTLLAELEKADTPLTKPQIQRRFDMPRLSQMLDRLLRKGLINTHQQIQPPTVRPRTTRVVHLASNWQDHVSSRAKAQLRLAEWLKQQGPRWMDAALAADASEVSAGVVKSMIDNGALETAEKRLWRDPLQGKRFVPLTELILTSDQSTVWQTIATRLDEPHPRPLLLQGVTGSGKTEIYMRAVRQVLERGQSAIVLVPEIALTPQTIRRFGARFADTLAVLHSKLSAGERYDQWNLIRSGDLKLVVGSRSALFAPVQDLGLIVIDEEHESSYKQERTPCYHARETAIELARIHGATLILGSATPSLESAYAVERGEFERLVMPRRVMGHRLIILEQEHDLDRPASHFNADADTQDALFADLPEVEIVDMRAELLAHNTSILSRALDQSIQQSLDRHEQIILFLNRRGAASFVSCRDCGYVVKCPKCLIPLTYHTGREVLLCHHCNYSEPTPKTCPVCGSRRIRYFGTGTQKVEQVVQQKYPGVRVVRWDVDTTGGKLDHERILDQFINGQADIMVGTQMIAKGLDLPRVTLVGVVTADTMLNLPDLRANERTFQLLTQVAGRAGRSILGGRVIIQTYTPEHPAIQAASQHDYDGFYASEIAFRREHWYPPVSRMARLLYLNPNNDLAEEETNRVANMLNTMLQRQGLADTRIIGPAPAFFSRIRGRYRWQIILQSLDPGAMLRQIELPLGWRIDIDPVSLL